MKFNHSYFYMIFVFSLLYLQLTAFSSCGKSNSAPADPLLFDSLPSAKSLLPQLNEISGIADSKANPGYLWGEEDSGNPPEVYLISHDGAVSKTVFIKGMQNRDWEDIALSGNDLYIGETGDNDQVYTEYRFYKFPEPTASTDTVKTVETIRFQYADGSHDCEAFLIDPATKNIYLITKRDNPSKIYRLAYPYSNSSLNTAELVGALPYGGVVSAAISADGKEIIIKTYAALSYYQRNVGETIEQTLKKKYTNLSYKMEPLGEAVSFAADGTGYYTLSEKGFGNSVNLYFYKRK